MFKGLIAWIMVNTRSLEPSGRLFRLCDNLSLKIRSIMCLPARLPVEEKFSVLTLVTLTVIPRGMGCIPIEPRVMKKLCLGTFPVVHWLRLCTYSAGGAGSISGWGTNILHAVWPKKN